jgi:hypothetical protein
VSTHQDRKRPADLSLPPVTINVSEKLLLEPPLGQGRLTTKGLRRALILIGYAQKIMVRDYKRVLRRNQESVQVSLPFDRLARDLRITWLAEEDRRTRLLALFGRLAREGVMGEHLDPPIIGGRVWLGTVHYEVARSWCWMPPGSYHKISITQMPLGDPDECRRWLRRQLR